MALIYVDQVKILKVEQLPYWYKNLYEWRDKIVSGLEAPVCFSNDQVDSRIWCLEAAFNRLGNEISIDGKYDDDLGDQVVAYGNTEQIDALILTSLLDELYEQAVIEMIDYKRVSQFATFTWPVDSCNITSGFGLRCHPITQKWKGHRGVDVGAVTPGVSGDEVHSILDGTVTKTNNSDADTGAGTTVEIKHGERLISKYFHLVFNSIAVKSSESVHESTIVGKMGETGGATGVHLHFEIEFFDGYEYRYLDPVLFFDFSILQ